MQLTLKRYQSTETCTHGDLFVNGVFECVTLEDTQRENKIYGQTAIPCGEYEIVISYSPRFKKLMPLLKNVPFFTGIRIHVLNSSKETDGCIGVGSSRIDLKTDWIDKSRAAYNKLFEKLNAAFSAGEKITIRIECY